ncbi:hypothetical protein AVEN_248365-1 [Araneus ventricosus]|uniref:Uncharacterized protein n=1 Tax=Araneus ventricosus TaxID=182803 RepID=A0A4Y2MFP1_ARAVE|nr:hypothetical protein AVEN_248365-1 [Araneus ventricosus]
MKTTPEVRMALCSCSKVRQETAALVIYHKPTFCSKKANSIMQLTLGGSINSASHVHVPTAQLNSLRTTITRPCRLLVALRMWPSSKG